MTDSSADSNSNASSRPPIQVGSRRHFTSNGAGIPWKSGGGETTEQPSAPSDRPASAAQVPPAPAPAAPAPVPAPAPAPVEPTAASTAAPAAASAAPAAPVIGPGVLEVGKSYAAEGSAAAGAGGSGAGGPGGGERGGKRERGGRGKERPKQPLQLPSTKDLMPQAVVPKPSKRDKLPSDLEDEFSEALGGVAFDRLMSGGYATQGAQELLELDSRRAATVVRLRGDDVFFVLGGRNEGVASARQFATLPEVGQSYDVVVRGFNAEDGLYEVVVPGASIEVSDWSDLSEGAIVDAQVTAANTGGLECTVNKIRGFIPASQVSLYRVENLGDFVGQRLLCVVTEANPQRRNLVLSRRGVLEREKEEAKRNFYANLEIGQIHEGVVRKIEDFGAFVDLGGGDGLIHISQLSWERVKHPSEVLKEGEKVRVRIEKIDPQTGKIGLSLRSLQEHPWEGIESRFPVGAAVKGVVSRLAAFGAFVKLAPGVEGLIHVSELAHYRVSNVKNVVKEGQDVEVKILSVDPEAQRISLSLKAMIAAPVVEKPAGEAAEAEEPPRKPAVPRWSGQLKGGFDRPTGGEGLGLKW